MLLNGCNHLSEVHISDIATWCKIEFGEPSNNPLTIAKHLYMDGKEVTKIVIPNGVLSISDYAFNNCYSLTSISIPSSVNSIGKNAFSSCPNLTSIRVLSETPIQIYDKNTFDRTGNFYTITLEVPKGSKDAYKMADVWSNFWEIVEVDSNDNNLESMPSLYTTPVLISAVGNTLNFWGVDNVNHIEFYNLSGAYLGVEHVFNGEASFVTDEKFVIVKIGEETIKVKK